VTYRPWPVVNAMLTHEQSEYCRSTWSKDALEFKETMEFKAALEVTDAIDHV
jgi:hypothetical protein